MRKTAIVLICFLAFPGFIKGQNLDVYNYFLQFDKLYNTGDLFNAENSMLKVLDFPEPVPEAYLVAANNNLSVVNNLLGRYQEALNYNKQAENLVLKKGLVTASLADIYLNKARTYNLQKKYASSIEFLERSIRIYTAIKNPDNKVLFSLSAAYQNLSVSYQGLDDLKTAIEYLKKSADLKLKHKLAGKGLIYLNIANTTLKSGDSIAAEYYYLKSINELKGEFGENYFRLPDVYFEYSLLLRLSGRNTEALAFLEKALGISIKNFGNKHPNVSNSFQYIGDYYSSKSVYSKALEYYQKAMIALVKNFNNQDIDSNPPLDSSYMDLDLLKILHKKSDLLAEIAVQQEDPELKMQTLLKSSATMDLALQLINKIYDDYVSDESRLYLMENEKETYFSAAQRSLDLYQLTGNPEYKIHAFDIARESKSANLRHQVIDDEILGSIGLPGGLNQNYRNTLSNIAAYNHLIYEETKKPDSNIKNIDAWKELLFSLNREKEKLRSEINMLFPQYLELFKKTDPLDLKEIQLHLRKDETLVEYFISRRFEKGQRKLIIYAVTSDSLFAGESILDSSFDRDVNSIKRRTLHYQSMLESEVDNRSYANALYAMYSALIKPMENRFAGKRLIIVPDEEISNMAFDAFITNRQETNQVSFEEMPYLLKRYSFTYGYSSSLLFSKHPGSGANLQVYAYSPEYDSTSGGLNRDPNFLYGTGSEINAVFKWFKGKKYMGARATENNFRKDLYQDVIFHLAMHTRQDTANSNYSYLVFNPVDDTIDDGRLFNYEISLSKMESPMVVLSACNTGTGTNYPAEGVISLARGFILAGASSVIVTSWEINDEVSSAMITDFYSNLAKGMTKDEALQKAKLSYLSTASPSYANPYFWAAYQVVGDNSALIKSHNNKQLLLLLAALAVFSVPGIFYFRRLRIFLERSR